MPYTNNVGIRIRYEVEGAGPPLVLQHGFTSSLDNWYECGYVTALCEHYHLILVDARGHGGSDKPHDEASYTLDRRVADVTAVLDAIGVEKAHFWGYSMGGTIGFGMAKFAPHRINALVIGGQHPYAVDRSRLRRWVEEGVAHGGDALVEGFRIFAGPISDSKAKQLREGDLEAWLAMLPDTGSMEDMLGSIALPCCLYAGEADAVFDKARLASTRIPDARFFSIPGLSHRQAFVESGLVVPPVIEFLRTAE